MQYSPDKAQPITRRAEERVASTPSGTSIFGDPVYAGDQVAMKVPTSWQTRGAAPAYAGYGDLPRMVPPSWQVRGMRRAYEGYGDTPAAPNPMGIYVGIGIIAIGLAAMVLSARSV